MVSFPRYYCAYPLIGALSGSIIFTVFSEYDFVNMKLNRHNYKNITWEYLLNPGMVMGTVFGLWNSIVDSSLLDHFRKRFLSR